MGSRARAAILDVDGTLIDSNDAHAQAWVDAGRELGYAIEFDRVRRLIGMGGDRVLPELTGLQDGTPEGDEIKKRRGAIFRARYLPHLRAFPGARSLLERMREGGLDLVVASSASSKDLQALLRQAGVDDLIEERTSASDVDASKPAPDVIQAALEAAGCAPGEAVMLGDTPYDVEASRRAGVAVIALRCGGWSDEHLGQADAIFDDASDLLANYERSPLAG